ncbi:MAG TPA: hypothetical protein PKV27_11095, partial [Ilumatobacteraceae bacterium]|nr:hypothetical protein [Ilumatobacteraceae bacterium]
MGGNVDDLDAWWFRADRLRIANEKAADAVVLEQFRIRWNPTRGVDYDAGGMATWDDVERIALALPL